MVGKMEQLGKRVKVFSKPVTREDFEGEAVIKQVLDDNVWEDYIVASVKFDGEKFQFTRKINRKDLEEGEGINEQEI